MLQHVQTQNGGAPTIADLAIVANARCEEKKLPVAKKIFSDMLGLISGREDGLICLSIHKTICKVASELESNEPPFTKLLNEIANESSPFRRCKLVIAATDYLNSKQMEIVMNLSTIKSINPKIKERLNFEEKTHYGTQLQLNKLQIISNPYGKSPVRTGNLNGCSLLKSLVMTTKLPKELN